MVQDNSSSMPVYSHNNNANNWNQYKKFKGQPRTGKPAPKVQQLHYCEICKISCAGPQTYKEHLDGQRHKKKEAAAKVGSSSSASAKRVIPGISIRCELCDITCTGNDAFAAHIRGSKHEKVIKLHTKLGKPIPSPDPALLLQHHARQSKVIPDNVPHIPDAVGKIKVIGTPCINFIGGGRLHSTQHSTGIQNKEVSNEVSEEAVPAPAPTESTTIAADSMPQVSTDSVHASPVTDSEVPMIGIESQVVGQEYVDDVNDGKLLTFHCKLCDCKIGDQNAKDLHLKGRRHRLAFKKKVDPSLVVDMGKQASRRAKVHDPNLHRNLLKQSNQHRNDSYGNTNHSARSYEERPSQYMPPPMPVHINSHQPAQSNMMVPEQAGFGDQAMEPINFHAYPQRQQSHGNSWDDAHILQKHSDIVPTEEELEQIHHVVSIAERALKLVSDTLAAEDDAARLNELIQTELMPEITGEAVLKPGGNVADPTQQAKSLGGSQPARVLKGLMRVGTLSKNLLLRGDRDVDLVVICAEKPTIQLLRRVAEILPQQFQVNT